MILNKYIAKKIPWVYTRSIMFFAGSLELVLFIVSLNFFVPNNIFGPYFMIFLASFFILLSYIFGRYNYKYDKFNSIIFYIFISSLLVYLLFFFSYLAIAKFNLLFLPPISFIGFSLYFIICIILQILINLFFINGFSSNNRWVFFGREKEFESLQILSKIGRNKKDLEYFRNVNFKDEGLLSSFVGVIYGEIYSLNNNELYYINKLQKKNIPIYDLLSWSELYLQRLPDDFLDNKEFLIKNFTIPKYSFQQRFKMVSELFLSFFILILSSPIIFISSLLIWINDRGPVFYSQIRVGKDGREFRMWKLRTMNIDAEKDGIQWSKKKDSRVTFVGNILRSTRIDELPQLFSVIKGEMSLIGPRPERPEIEEILKKNIKNYELRHLIKPGVSGWAQVNYPYGASIEDTKNKLSFDLYYVKNISLLLDLLIFFKTIKTIFNFKSSRPFK